MFRFIGSMIKFIFGMMVLGVVIVVLGVILLPIFIGTQDIEDFLNEQLADQGDVRVEIAGRASIGLIPDIALKARHVTIVQGDVRYELEHIKLAAKTWQLLNQKRPEVVVTALADGVALSAVLSVASWQTLVQGAPTVAAMTMSQPVVGHVAGVVQLVEGGVKIGALEISAEQVIKASGDAAYYYGGERPRIELALDASYVRDLGLMVLVAPAAGVVGDAVPASVPVAVRQALAARERADFMLVELPFGLLNELDATLKMTAKVVEIDALRFDDVKLIANLSGGVLRIMPIAGRGFGGVASGRLMVDVTGDVPAVEMSVSGSGLAVAEMLQLAEMEPLLDGRMALDGQIVARGNTAEELLATLSGQGSVEIVEGVVQGVELGALRRITPLTWQSGLFGEAAATEFSAASMSWTAQDGVIVSDDVLVKTDVGEVLASGNLDVKTQVIDARLQPVMAVTQGVRLPAIVVRGPVNDPQVAPDIAGLVEGGLQKIFGKDAVPVEGLPDMVEELFEGLF